MYNTRRRQCKPQGDVDVRGQRDVAERVESHSGERERDHYRACDGFYGEQTGRDHGDPAPAVVKGIHCANMCNRNQSCVVNKR
jgi:hypothetical protein